MTNPEGLKAARRYAGWNIGYPSWADQIIHVYLNPAEANAEMDNEEVPMRTGVRRDEH